MAVGEKIQEKVTARRAVYHHVLCRIFILVSGITSHYHILRSECTIYILCSASATGAGVIQCIEKALFQSGVSKEDVNYINAHATSTPAGDLKEYNALIHCFGQNPELRINSTKSMIGHLLGAAGAVEAVAVVQAIRTGWVHPNVNLEDPDKGVDMKVLVGPKKERLDINVALSNSFGFGGHNSSVLFAPYK